MNKTIWLIVGLIFIFGFGAGALTYYKTKTPAKIPESQVRKSPDFQPKVDVYPEVWSKNGYDGASYEFKTNCGSDYDMLETCFLWEVTRVVVRGPNSKLYELNKDFNQSAYSGEITRRWVLYGPAGAGLPVAGNYSFTYYKGDVAVFIQTVNYAPSVVEAPSDISWRREGNDLVVAWQSPAGITSAMWYKVIVFRQSGQVLSQTVEWNASETTLKNLPLEPGEEADINVSSYFEGGYAYPESVSIVWMPVSMPKVYSKETKNHTPIVLSGNEIVEVTNEKFTQKNNVILSGNAKLIIQDSFFEHIQDYSSQFTLQANDNAQVIIKNSEIKSSPWLNWNFADASSLMLENVQPINSNIWHSFMGRAKAIVKSSPFHASLAGNVLFDILDSPNTFIEMVYPVGASVDEELPKNITESNFPNSGENSINFKLKIKNSQALAWGITTGPGNKVTIRNADPLVVTYAIKSPWENVTATFSNLGEKLYKDATWTIEDSWLRLVNVRTWPWSPIVGDGNTLIVKNSVLADNQFSWGNSRIIIEDSTTSLIGAKDSVDITLKNSTVNGDLITKDSGRITLINTKVIGKKIIEGSGKIIEQ